MAPNSRSREQDIETLLRPYVPAKSSVPTELYDQLERYLELLLKWNSRTNLTAIRDPSQIVNRHFGESLFAAQHLGECETVLDFGSGAGFPGIPIHLFRPDLQVTLAESQNKKATFLREVVRTLGLKTEIWSGRVEAMPASLRFDVVTLRAVDNMDEAVAVASTRAAKRMLLLTTRRQSIPALIDYRSLTRISIPQSEEQEISILERLDA